MTTYIIPCRVTLDGALMIIEANSAEEAESRARKNEWEDIDYKTAGLVDWEITGSAKPA